MGKTKVLRRKSRGILLLAVMLTIIFSESVYGAERPADKEKPDEGNVMVGVEGTFSSATKEEILNRINEIRKEACENGIRDPRDGKTSLKSSDYEPIEWSADLEWIAQLRAAEACVNQDHTRPNGKRPWFTYNGISSNGENLAWNSGGMMQGIEQWYGEKADWINDTQGAVTGHYTILINPDIKYVGLGAFQLASGGWIAVSGEFLGDVGRTLDSTKSDLNGACTQLMEVSGANVSSLTVSGVQTMNGGEEKVFSVSGEMNMEDAWGNPTVFSAPITSGLTWTSSNPKAVTVDAQTGKVKAVGSGTSIITASVGKVKGTYTVTVKGIGNVTDSQPVKTVSGTAPVLPEKLTVTWSDGTTSEASVTWEAIPEEKYMKREGGTFTVDGTVKGYDGKVTVTVQVDPAVISTVEYVKEVTTPSGTKPVLSEKANVVWSNGDKEEVTITWEEIAADDYNVRTGKVFDVDGVISELNDYKVTCKVTIEKATVVSADYKKEVTTESGTAPSLPDTAKVTWSNGDVTDEKIVWDSLEKETYSKREGGSFDAKGAIEGTAQVVACRVTVKPAVKVSAEAPSAITSLTGSEPVLPKTVKVTWSNGDVTNESVVWDSIDPSEYAAENDLVVNGTVEGYDEQIQQQIHVRDVIIAEVNSPAVVITEAGQEPVLPAVIEVVFSDGTKGNVAVIWDELTEEQYHSGGEFKVSGIIDAWNDSVEITVHVNDEYIISVDEIGIEQVETEAGKAPEMPKTVNVNYSNGDKAEKAIVWNISEEQYHNGGEFIAEGMIEGYENSIKCKVIVRPATLIGVEPIVEIKTFVGEAPVLPKVVKGIWSNGDHSDVAVKWNEIPKEQYAKKGKFIVKGKANDVVEVSISVEVIEKVTGSIDTEKPNTQKPNAAKASGSQNAPKTGDNTLIYIWWILMGISVLGMIYFVKLHRKPE